MVRSEMLNRLLNIPLIALLHMLFSKNWQKVQNICFAKYTLMAVFQGN